MVPSTPISSSLSASDDAESPGGASAQDAEPPEPENGGCGDGLGTFVIHVMMSDQVGDDHPAVGLFPALGEILSDRLSRVGRILHVEAGEITINLIDDDEMIELHTHYCDDDSTTDILTFDLDESEGGVDDSVCCDEWSGLALRGNRGRRLVVHADIALCVDQAMRQVEERGHGVIDELTLYSIHGLLHLLGHDDHGEEDYRMMHELEDAILQEIGLPATFAG